MNQIYTLEFSRNVRLEWGNMMKSETSKHIMLHHEPAKRKPINLNTLQKINKSKNTRG